jgi:hypothetical protein
MVIQIQKAGEDGIGQVLILGVILVLLYIVLLFGLMVIVELVLKGYLSKEQLKHIIMLVLLQDLSQ